MRIELQNPQSQPAQLACSFEFRRLQLQVVAIFSRQNGESASIAPHREDRLKRFVQAAKLIAVFSNLPACHQSIDPAGSHRDSLREHFCFLFCSSLSFYLYLHIV